MLLLTLATRACLAVGGLSIHPASPIHLNSSNMTSLDGKEELWGNLNGLAILNPLAPHWQMLTEPGLWLEATIQVSLTWRKEELSSDTCVFFQVVLSLQLGTGAFTAFASSCLPRHNTVASFVCRVSVKKPFSAGPRLSGDQPVSPCLAPPFPPSHPRTLASLIISVLTRDTSLLGEKHCFSSFLSPQT